MCTRSSFKQELQAELQYTYPANRLKWGHAYGNSYCFVTLDPKSDIMQDEGTTRIGIRESTNQHYYLLQWEVAILGTDGAALPPADTTMKPAYQQTTFPAGAGVIRKKFFLPFENNYLRAAHVLLEQGEGAQTARLQSRLIFPSGTVVEKAEYKGQSHVQAGYPDGTTAILWGSDGLCAFTRQEMTDGRIEVVTEYDWLPDEAEFGLSFAYDPAGSPVAPANPHNALNGVFDVYSPTAQSPGDHLLRLRTVLAETKIAINRYLDAARLVTPDSLINRGVQWAKVNQLRDQQEYKWGSGFSNNPPSDIVVGRDSAWYLAGSSFYAQPWSKKLFEFWFRYGQEVSGKFTEYMTGSGDPLFKDDYGMNINDNTPLFILAAHRYFSLTGDLGFLHATYMNLLEAANCILQQRFVGKHNPYGLVWCTTEEDFMRGLCGWRNCIKGYNLSGAVTEVNAECFVALQRMAELAEVIGDQMNRNRFTEAAEGLKQAIERYLRSTSPANPYYSLMISAKGERVDDMTADLLFPVLFDIADDATAAGILAELFSERIWAETDNGGGGMRTVSAAQEGYHPDADFYTYGLMGGVWPNLALWTARAAAGRGAADLCLKALRGTLLLADRDDPARYNVVPGELPEFFNGDDLVQRNQPRSTFLSGILIWAAIEGFFGLTPHPGALTVQPTLPEAWPWVALTNMPYKGYPLSMIAVRDERTLYTTVPVDSDWKQVIVSASLQESIRVTSDQPIAWLVISDEEHTTLLAAAAETTHLRVRQAGTDRILADCSIPAGDLVRVPLS